MNKQYKINNRLFAVSLSGLMILLMSASVFAADWLNSDWGYRKIITIDNNSNSNSLTNYPVIVQLGSSNFDFNLAEPNGGDLRFTKDDGLTPLDFWIEDYNKVTQSAVVWVEIPSIPSANSVNIYMYYDNPGAAAASNGTATFDLFDDFSGTTLDASKWNSGGTPTIDSGILTINSIGQYIRSKQTYLYKAFRTKSKFASYANWGYLGFNIASLSVGGNDAMILCFNASTVQPISSSGGAWTWGSSITADTNWKKWDVLWKANEVKFVMDGTVITINTTHVPSIALYAQINDNSGSPIVQTDWVLVRNYSSPEPTSVLGPAQQCPPIPKFISTPVTDAFVGETYIYDADANGAEPLSYQLVVYPEGMIIDANTGVISWTPTEEQSGNNDVTVKATNENGSAFQSYNVTVSRRLDPSRWMYKRQIIIDNTTNPNDLNDYPVKIILDSNDFNFADANTNGEDIRFTKSNGISAIDYWIETWDRDSQHAIIWANVPIIPASGLTEIYMYYGDPYANAVSNGDATFDFFDDFKKVIYAPPGGVYGNWPRVVIDNYLDGAHNVLVENVDDDNKPDIVADAYRAGVVVWYEHPSDPVNDVWPKHIIDSDLPNAHDIEIGDIDGDGKRDIVALSNSATWQDYTAGQGYLCWYKKPDNVHATSSSGWTSKSPLPSPLADSGAAVYNNKLYIFGGHHFGGVDPQNASYFYEPTTNTWTPITNMPTLRWGQMAVEFNGKIHVFAGNNGSGGLALHQIYDPITDSWSTSTDVPAGIADHGLMGIKYGNYIYLFRSQYTYKYDPANDTYERKADIPTPRVWGTCALVNDIIYLIGGGPDSAGSANEAYNPATDTWTTKTPMPVARWGATRDNPVINGKIYVTHGMLSDFYTTNYVYDTATDTWTQKSSGMNPRDGVSCGVINNKLYVAGGRDDDILGGTGRTYVEEYDPVNDIPQIWTKTIIAQSGREGLLDCRSAGLGDLDGDGNLDIAVAVDGYHYGTTGKLLWYKNPGGTDALDPNKWHQYLIDSTQGNGCDAQIGDIDEDGHPDIVYCADLGSPLATFIYFAPSDPTNIAGWQRMAVAGGSYHCYLVDYDGDGHLDILLASIDRGCVSWLKNPLPADPRNPANWKEYIIDSGGPVPRFNRVQAVDIDGDGDLDMGVETNTGTGGAFKWYRRPSDPTNISGYDIYTIDDDPCYTAYGHDAYFADIDGDGRVDAVGAAAGADYGSNQGNKITLYLNKPGLSPVILDPNKWTYSDSTNIFDGVVTVSTTSGYLRSKQSFLYKALRTKARFQVYDDYGYIGFNPGYLLVQHDDAMFVSFKTPTVQSITCAGDLFTWGYNYNEGTDWKTWDILWRQNEAKFYVNDTLRATHTTTVPSINQYVQFNDVNNKPTTAVEQIDWVLVRNYSSPEPNALVGPAIPIQFIITASADANGSISPSGTITKNSGDSQLFTATPSEGYTVDKWSIDGAVVQTGGTTYTLSNIVATHTVSVMFKIQTFSVTASSDANGSISPSGTFGKDYGSSQLFSAIANTGYTVDKWTVDGNVAQTGGTTYTLGNITAAHTIVLSFKMQTFSITASSDANGSISPSGTFGKDYGSSQLFSAIANIGYTVDTWFVDGNSVQAGGSTYTLTNIQDNHTVYVAFKSSGKQIAGTIDINTLSSASYSFNRAVVFKATDSSGNVLKQWTVTVNFTNNTVMRSASGSYTLADVPNTTANLSAKTAWSLRKRQSVVFSGNSAIADFTNNNAMLGGDLNGSNSVNIMDYSILKSNWYTTNALADITGDGVVNLLDYAIMKDNFLKVGDSE
ncbi:MAG: DUF2341 domain-containing protein [Sedimentisphaerales bacterium]